MLRDTGNTEAAIIEYGFLDSSGDDVEQLKNNYEQYAEAVVRALVDYVGGTYVPVAGSGYYVVQKGDSLWSIAKKYNTTAKELQDLNNLKSTSLSIGQMLKIPTDNNATSTDNDYYIVKSGDTLYKIAQSNNTTVQDLINLNNLTSTNLSVGQKIKLKSTPTTPVPNNTYTVVKGDSLYAIANKYGVSVQDIIDANKLKSSALSVGQQLVIPSSKENEELYTVVSGDSLYKIAQKYNTTVNELKQLNNLTSNTLSVGQKLKIPSTDNYITYTVKAGDNLYKIAQNYNTTVATIQSINNLSTANLSIGQKLLIPNKN